jgi:hypothetical protein
LSQKIPNPLTTLDTSTWWTSRGLANLMTFLVGSFILGMAILMALKFVIDLFLGDQVGEWSWPQLAVIILTTLVGLVICGINKYRYNNQLIPKVITIYTWLCVGFTLVIYLRVIVRTYQYDYIFPERFQHYIIALLMSSLTVFILPVLRDLYYIQRFSIPILIGNLIHLLMIMQHYMFSEVFTEQMIDPVLLENIKAFDITIYHYFGADIFLFLFMLVIALLMLRNPRVMVNIKNRLDKSFQFTG